MKRGVGRQSKGLAHWGSPASGRCAAPLPEVAVATGTSSCSTVGGRPRASCSAADEEEEASLWAVVGIGAHAAMGGGWRVVVVANEAPLGRAPRHQQPRTRRSRRGAVTL
nr:unnamed protein product [Digitaria exilis]